LGSHLADDVLSETFLIAFSKRQKYDLTREDARPWLYGIASNLIGRHTAGEAHQLKVMAARPEDEVALDAFDGASERLDAIAQVRDLAVVLRALARRDRETLLLYAWADLTYEGIAEATSVSVGTVKSRLNRARNKVRSATAPGSDPEPQVGTEFKLQNAEGQES
jgi:RNA polymerase sigma-70 factor (ECF subfamily)